MGNALLRCCVPTRSLQGQSEDDDGPPPKTPTPATNRVQLAASELFTVPGLATAYHTSVLVNGEEFFFSDSGILWDRSLTSHQGQPSELVDVGLSRRTGSQLLAVLQPHFMPGSYDLIQKNCNSFSDCALHFLLEKRLDRRYSALERLGQRASASMLQRFTKGMYVPNPVAADFSVESVIGQVDKLPELERQGPAADAAQLARSRPALSIGARVTVVGLKNAEALNGQGAVIQRYNAVNGRWEASINFTGEIKALRAENLRPAGELVLQPGDSCRIHSLKSETGQALNGQEGTVLRYLHDVSRYEVDVGGMTKALKAENLQVVQAGAR
mmetsp:Transcript_22805/g.72202  ORF Transcript_22805/g.72202 Transcript_22805/m.72202 type:complete len:328 (+) Transcript_22805:75-1058(+)